eukprot:NODE_54_length_2387_cov_74.717280_g40_i0.p1 GENE.NODE_54_length_2387_cov_74.717280_g40_i0~~NODE_54_length_2387_cov_74.717280_g40_i0.p1  ORF type:complete len:330 (+),score=45.92 NODE_54_length_2387_cov_74.717280_g40_i0:1147-2136(+)
MLFGICPFPHVLCVAVVSTQSTWEKGKHLNFMALFGVGVKGSQPDVYVAQLSPTNYEVVYPPPVESLEMEVAGLLSRMVDHVAFTHAIEANASLCHELEAMQTDLWLREWHQGEPAQNGDSGNGESSSDEMRGPVSNPPKPSLPSKVSPTGAKHTGAAKGLRAKAAVASPQKVPKVPVEVDLRLLPLDAGNSLSASPLAASRAPLRPSSGKLAPPTRVPTRNSPTAGSGPTGTSPSWCPSTHAGIPFPSVFPRSEQSPSSFAFTAVLFGPNSDSPSDPFNRKLSELQYLTSETVRAERKAAATSGQPSSPLINPYSSAPSSSFAFRGSS